MEPVRPQKEHEWLQKLVGEWTYEFEAPMEPGGAPQEIVGQESVRSIGGLWIVAEGSSDSPGGGMSSVLTLGYDPAKGRFVGTFISSMMAMLWSYEGSLDASGKVLTLDSEGPTMEGEGKMGKYQDIVEIVSDDHRRLHSQMLGPDGEWKRFMTIDYRRKR